MIAAQGVAAAGVVAIDAAVRGQQIPGLVIDTAIAVSRAIGTGFAGVVVDYVKPDLNALKVEGFDHSTELLRRAIGVLGGGITPVRGEEVEGHVTPEAAFLGIALMDGHQFYGCNSKALEVRYLFRKTGEGPAQSGVYAGIGTGGEALDMQLVDDQVVAGTAGSIPVSVGRGCFGQNSKRRASVGRAGESGGDAIVVGREEDGRGEGIEKDLLGVETEAGSGVVAAFDAICVVSCSGRFVGLHPAVPDPSRLVDSGLQAVFIARVDGVVGSVKQ
jgi:hypothetical protein